jgi:hypothetical protein
VCSVLQRVGGKFKLPTMQAESSVQSTLPPQLELHPFNKSRWSLTIVFITIVPGVGQFEVVMGFRPRYSSLHGARLPV